MDKPDGQVVLWFRDCNLSMKNLIGGKNSSLGELINLSSEIGFSVADGFCLTTLFYDKFLSHNNLTGQIEKMTDSIDHNNLDNLKQVSDTIKSNILAAQIPDSLLNLVETNYKKFNCPNIAVRSSAIAEDLPTASFAGQQDTYLNITSFEELVQAIKMCIASLYNVSAISYRRTHKITNNQVKISVGIQRMVRSDIGSAGVAFSVDPDTGYAGAVFINSSFGLGESVVGGVVKPDEIIVDKRTDRIVSKNKGVKSTKCVFQENGVQTVPNTDHSFSISDQQCVELANIVKKLEITYSELFDKKLHVDVEWAVDGTDGNIYILQTRPETVFSNKKTYDRYSLLEKGEPVLRGIAIGRKITTGRVRILRDIRESAGFEKGDILVTGMTTPDWEPLMKISSGVVTDKGGRTCHAAIIARELGINAVIGTQNATKVLQDGQTITVSCEKETGEIYDGALPFSKESSEQTTDFSKFGTNVMFNIGNPETAFGASVMHNGGVGLVRLEFIINNFIKVHPLALVNYSDVPDKVKEEILEVIGDSDPVEFFINKLSEGISRIASAFYPNDVIVRLSDFKTNEYKNMIGGHLYESEEENPMLGWRGCSRYYSDSYRPAFDMECRTIKKVRERFSNIIVMLPFCRTPKECKRVVRILGKHGLERGMDGLKIYIMCELPSNVMDARGFSKYIDGVSIGGNDLMQLTLGIDRDSEKIAYLSDQKDKSFRKMVRTAIRKYHRHGKKVGFCGQQPSESKDFFDFLVKNNIDSISVIPDSIFSLR